MAKRNLPFGGATPMEPGERDRVARMEQLTETIAPSGRPVEGWTTLVEPYWVRRDDLKGHERFAANQLSAPFTTRWEGGYRADCDPELVDVPKVRRLVYQGRAYDIVEASQIGRREGIEFLTLAKGKVS